MSKVIGYLRISTNKQDIDSQKLAIMTYGNAHQITIDEFMEIQASSRLSQDKRKIDVLLEKLKEGDTLIVSELSRLARSLGQIIQIIDELIKNKIKFYALKENIVLDGKYNMQSKVMVTLFGLFAEIERDLISERTKEALQALKAKGIILGRPKGALGRETKLDGKEKEIKELLDKGMSKTGIAIVMKVTRSVLVYFIETKMKN